MAQQPRQKTIRIDDNWECSLSAAPDRVRKRDEPTLTVTLSRVRANDQPKLTITLSNRAFTSENIVRRSEANSRLTASFKTRGKRAKSASSP
jgi:hypothetical protein